MKIINLLPKPRQELLRQEATFRSLLSFFWISLFTFALVIAVQAGVKIYLQTQGNAINNSIEILQAQVKKQENSTVKKQITVINNYIADYKNLSTGIPKWSKVLKAFAPLPPRGVVVNSFVIDFNKKSVNINGTAPTRELVIELYNNILQDEKEFYNIDYPLENVAKPKDISFHFTFYIKDEVIK